MGDARKVYWTLPPRRKQFVAARRSAPKTIPRPRSRGDAAIAMNCSPEKLRSGAGLPNPDAGLKQALASILFVDIVGSTAKAARLGDARWTQVMNPYYAAVRRELKTLRGKEVVTTGRWTARDVRAAGIRYPLRDRNPRGEVRTLGLEIRIGLHAGEYKVSGPDVVGLAFHVGARVAAKARPGEVLVSSAVKKLMPPSQVHFKDRGAHRLKGVPERWRLYRVEY